MTQPLEPVNPPWVTELADDLRMAVGSLAYVQLVSGDDSLAGTILEVSPGGLLSLEDSYGQLNVWTVPVVHIAAWRVQ